MARGSHPGGIWWRRDRLDRGVDHPRRDQPLRRELGSMSRPDVYDGHAAAAWLARAETRLPATHRLGRIALAVLRRHRADHRHRHHENENLRREARGALYHQRSEGMDLTRSAFGPDAAAGAHHATRADQEENRGLICL